jgi:uncharacterized damage-inducible protein DinB
MFAERRERRLERLLEDHMHAVDEFVGKAEALKQGQWLTPRAEGKWTPAQETMHVILAYEVFLRELSGGAPMALKGSPWKRRLWRLIGLTPILWRKRISVAVRAPRETRPDLTTACAEELLPQLRRRAEELDASFAVNWRSNPRKRVTHFTFGELSLDQAMRLVAVHTRHHAALLPAPPFQEIIR